MVSVPPYLEDYVTVYEEKPREAAIEWFEDATYGLFLHYGLYSLLGNHEWVQYDEKIPLAEYALLRDYFNAEGFDAKSIVEFATDAGMNYINLTTKHHDGFCLFDTAETTYKSTEAPAGRDLVGEIAEECHDAGLGFFCYYSIGVDWRHPHAPNRKVWGDPARPDYDEIPKVYAGSGHDLGRYLDYVESQLLELLEYEPAGIWLDPAVFSQQPGKAGWNPEPFNLTDIYESIRSARPEILISYKDGVTGTEDFVAPELYYDSLGNDLEKPGEVCACMLPGEEYADEVRHSWGYLADGKGKHKNESEVWNLLENVTGKGYNLLLNTGPLPDGSLDPEDTTVLRNIGDRIEREGFPSG